MINWNENQNRLLRSFEFKNFQEALAFVNLVGVIAEDIQHHPDIRIFNFKQVEISITTHDAGNKITDKDYTLAERIDGVFG
jgi:4a-hydroxytetrahydrobiopterin dehydratase